MMMRTHTKARILRRIEGLKIEEEGKGIRELEQRVGKLEKDGRGRGVGGKWRTGRENKEDGGEVGGKGEKGKEEEGGDKGVQNGR